MAISDGGGTIRLTTEPVAPPGEASFFIKIDFQKGAANPQRVFQAADAMIRALQDLDRTLCTSVDSGIEPIMVLEDIEAGSIKVWLGNQLNRVDDEGLKTLDWRPIVGKYLVRAKYAVIDWSNKKTPGFSLVSLAQNLRMIASETDVRYLPDYAPPSVQELSKSARDIDSAKDFLLPDDKISYSAVGMEPVEFNLLARWKVDELINLAVRDTTKFENMQMILIIRKPDYLGKSKWDFRFGKKPLSAKIEDNEWLLRFQTRKVDVRPGDGLKCLTTIEHKYGFDNELIAEEYTVTKVEAVMDNQFTQSELDLRGE